MVLLLLELLEHYKTVLWIHKWPIFCPCGTNEYLKYSSEW